MKLNLMLTGALAALTIFAAGCGGMSTDDKGAKGDENDLDLAGKWIDGCLAKDALKLTHQANVLTFSALGDFDRVTTLHRSDVCAEPQIETSVHGTYDVVGQAENVQGGADNINFTVLKATVTAKSDDAVQILSAAAYCGVKDWTVDQEIDIAGKDCLGEKVASGQVLFDIYRIEGDDKTLFVGNSMNWFDNTDSVDRPTQLATDHPYTKQ